ncbi:exo-alpha-sialidase [Chitinophaga lutea]
MKNITLLLYCLLPVTLIGQTVELRQVKYKVPVLLGKAVNPGLRLEIDVPADTPVEELEVNLQGPAAKVQAWWTEQEGFRQDSAGPWAEAVVTAPGRLRIKGKKLLPKGRHYCWLSVTPRSNAPLTETLRIDVNAVKAGGRRLPLSPGDYTHRMGVALRQHRQDGVHTYRIPGLATAKDGTLLAIYDARRTTGRDLQGDIDIGLSRSTDKGQTWQPMQIVMDMGEWGGLPQKFNGVSDANILVDKNTGDIYIAGLWMHGVITPEGKWVEGLSDTSTVWNHQWKPKGSQPGFGVRETSQFMIVKSADNGRSWSEPRNITRMVKQEAWWLIAPAPGQGITLRDGTIVFPTQGRDPKGRSFSNITWSRDSGRTWTVSRPAAAEQTTENMAVELSDGSIMLNMRSGANSRDTSATNGRVIAVTSDLGRQWSTHPTSHGALPEPACMASIIRHDYTKNGVRKSVLLFSNPDAKTARRNLSIKASYDDGRTWHTKVLLDEGKSRGYSCLTSIDEKTIGIVYESSQADLVFQRIALEEVL